MEISHDFLLYFDRNEIFVNYSFINCAHSCSFLPLLKLKALESPKKIDILETLSKIHKVPYSFMMCELRSLVEAFLGRKNLKFPINLTKICQKWSSAMESKSFCESLADLKRKAESNETRSTDNEDPVVFSLTPTDEIHNSHDSSVILLEAKEVKKGSDNIQKKPDENEKNLEKPQTKKTTYKDLMQRMDMMMDIEIPIEIAKCGQPRKKVKDRQEPQPFQKDFQLYPGKIEDLKKDYSLRTFNDIDSESVPDFIYVTENICHSKEIQQYFEDSEKAFQDSIQKKGFFQIVCDCKASCNEDCICARYNKQYLNDTPPYKLLKGPKSTIVQKTIIQENIKPFTHIFECSKYCSCNKDLCSYHLLGWKQLQMVPEQHLIVKRYKKYFSGTDEQIVMWGLMTTMKIPINTLVIEYLGEIISKGEADIRGKYYDKLGKNYLFDLTMAVEYKCESKSGPIFCIDNYMKCRKKDEKETLLRDFPLCIDGFYYGNLSRFINHSCNPNLQVLSIHVENREILLPRVVLFSTREIAAGEELTFDYNCYPLSTDKELKCACGDETCRGVIYN